MGRGRKKGKTEGEGEILRQASRAAEARALGVLEMEAGVGVAARKAGGKWICFRLSKPVLSDLSLTLPGKSLPINHLNFNYVVCSITLGYLGRQCPSLFTRGWAGWHQSSTRDFAW